MRKDVEKIIKSGLLESYIMGTASTKEVLEVEALVRMEPRIQKELAAIELRLEQYALQNAVQPPAKVKSRLFETLADEFLESDTSLSYPSLLDNQDLTFWRNKVKHLSPPIDYKEIFIHDLEDPNFETKVIWVDHYVPPETHHNIRECFLILEGSCKCTLGGNQVISLKAGDFMEIPLHISHDFLITSECATQFILQRIAA